MKLFLPLSLLLNVALAAVAVWLWRQPGPAAQPAPTAAPSHSVANPAPNAMTRATPPPGGEVFITNAFQWAVLESTNYATFVANLRTIGCPDRTIRDLIFADAERRYADLDMMEAEPLPFWLAGKARVAATRRNETNRTAAQTELRAELRRLFGVDWSPEEGEANDLKFQAFSRLLTGPVTDEQHEYAWRWVLATVEQARAFRQERRILLTSDTVQWEQRTTDRLKQLAAVLSPPVFEEFQARTTMLDELWNSESVHLKDLELSPDETRRVCLAKVRDLGWLEELMQVERNKSAADQESKKIAFTAALQHELTPANFAEFVRVQDENYRELLQVTRNNDLPRTAAQTIYEVRQLAQAEAQRLQAEGTEAAAAALAELQIATADSVRKVLGPDVFKTFSGRNGSQWLTNFTKL